MLISTIVYFQFFFTTGDDIPGKKVESNSISEGVHNSAALVPRNTYNNDNDMVSIVNDNYEHDVLNVDGSQNVLKKYSEEDVRKQLLYLERAGKLLTEKKWEEFQDLLNTSSIDQLESLKLFLIQAIMIDSPRDIVLDLLNRGAPLDIDVFKALISLSKVDEIDSLRAYGLDIYMEETEGKNGIYYAVNNLFSIDALTYFISNGVEIKTGDFEDALDVIISHCMKGTDVSKYLEHLLDNGAELTSEHKASLNSLTSKQSLCGGEDTFDL